MHAAFDCLLPPGVASITLWVCGWEGSVGVSECGCVHVSIFLSSIYLFSHIHMYVSVYYLSIYLSIYLPKRSYHMYVSMYYLPIYLSIYYYFLIFFLCLFTGNDPANEDHPNSLRLILRGSPGPTA